MNLPMICPPLPFSKSKNKYTPPGQFISIDDIVGGYWTQPEVGLRKSSRLLTSREYDHFDFLWKNRTTCEIVCSIISLLQNKGFKKNSLMFQSEKKKCATKKTINSIVLKNFLVLPPIGTINTLYPWRLDNFTGHLWFHITSFWYDSPFGPFFPYYHHMYKPSIENVGIYASSQFLVNMLT